MTIHPLPTPGKCHPVDRMAELKSQIAELEREFAELRSRVISGDVDSVGEDWEALRR